VALDLDERFLAGANPHDAVPALLQVAADELTD